jgi:hypothetical protein
MHRITRLELPLQMVLHQPHDSHSTRWMRRKGAREANPPSCSPTLTNASHRPCLHKSEPTHTHEQKRTPPHKHDPYTLPTRLLRIPSAPTITGA